MKATVILALALGLAGCETVNTGHVTTGPDGAMYERQYYVIPTETLCTGTCVEQVKARQNYMKHHQ